MSVLVTCCDACRPIYLNTRILQRICKKVGVHRLHQSISCYVVKAKPITMSLYVLSVVCAFCCGYHNLTSCENVVFQAVVLF